MTFELWLTWWSWSSSASRLQTGSYKLPILGSGITQRVSYPGMAAVSTTVLEAEPDGDAAAGIKLKLI